MTVTFRLPSAHALNLIGFAWSPLFEAVLSLPAVVYPKRTPMHLPWARRCRQLPADLLDEINYLAGPLDCCIPGVFEVGLGGNVPSFPDELAALRAVDESLFALELSMACGSYVPAPADHDPNIVHDRDYRHTIVQAAAAGGQGRAELAKAALDDPGQLRDRYVEMLARYWEAAFSAEWDRLLPGIEAEVTGGAHALVTGGAPQLVAEFLPEGRWDPATSSIVIARDWDGERELSDGDRLLLVPTVYGWPRVLIELLAPWPAMVIFPLRSMRHPAVPHASDTEVVAGFRALSEETRLQIARLVAEHPRSTRELAQLLSLSDSAISRHLKIMEAAGLVAGRRDGYFVLYHLDTDRLDVLNHAMRATLGLSRATTGPVPPLPVSVSRVDYQRQQPARW